MSSISYRDSIRWLPDDASEPTDTIVLTGRNSNIFVDVRFLKGTSELDWAFAGYRSTREPKQTQFIHLIDSRTTDAMSVEDCGTNTQLPDGRTLECGEMVNPATGQMAAYEEIWRDETHDEYLFVKNYEGNKWWRASGIGILASDVTSRAFGRGRRRERTAHGPSSIVRRIAKSTFGCYQRIICNWTRTG
ncbi:hypothetical protein BDZ89DRAFT_948515 [Hymenopellis radicata]|nr:hypothetical protein BDZ89DRAFT_948515 [Hymenopellis radicata]